MRLLGTVPRLAGSLLLVLAAGASALGVASAHSRPHSPGAPGAAVRPLGQIVPAPAQVHPAGAPFTLTPSARIRVAGHARDVRDVGSYLAGLLRPSTGYALPVVQDGGPGGGHDVRLALTSGDGALGAEGYRLDSGPGGVTLTARTPAGLFHGVQTLRQLLPASVEKRTLQHGPWQVAGGTVTDVPRYAYRGAMLDVSRHFFTVPQVEKYIDELALYKINELHLHLSDDQGWRIAIDSWPRLASYGGSTAVGGGTGGFYTKAQYAQIVGYAAARHLEVVPEIDMPSHTNAALASYAQLNCDGVAPPLYTGTEVGFSSLCVPKDVTYAFVDDVVRELAAITPGRYLHIGGDEAHSTSQADYVAFMNRAQAVVQKYGKTVMGWHQITSATPVPGAVAEYWGYDETGAAERAQVAAAAQAGTRLVLAPADRSYLDMKYDENTRLGQDWAGTVEVDRSYDWDPGTYLADAGVPASAVLGVEAPLWTETITSNDDIEAMAFPRLPGIAELGWSPESTHDWTAYKVRLAAQGPRMAALGIDFYRSPLVDWPAGS
ncbi:beta-N-acetylhexosaminidase [Actinacidiphila bryophytorum]|uniref:beta-N-acetylhexosaminidase n=1 Tax=Actinacidiphila bryophytorum TaxID=1436133 RepID=UPI002176C18B|nr:beta-N-acetylhexosaminidase [Actinacidiphila bryophytorum]UWE11124.1 beta-N-acetylhexosaminidase [Actinacidiphila bryophytorum]